MLSQKDKEQISQRGMTVKQIEGQIENFRKGFPFINLVAPATKGRGIYVFKETELDDLKDHFLLNAPQRDILKFVPASGAASRMFKHLFEFLDWYDRSDVAIARLESDNSFNSVNHFLKNLNRFAFINELNAALAKDDLHLSQLVEEKKFDVIVSYLLTDKGLGYAELPKGLLMFHKYDGFSRMAVGEHLVEGANYARNENGKVKIHFTVSPEHKQRFMDFIERRQAGYESSYKVQYDISFSEQKPSTDTIGVDMDNNPFREDDGKLHFRPGGHGALIENVNDLNGDIIFIKNIDNIVPDRLKEPTYLYKRVIGGLLLRLQEQTHNYLKSLETRNVSAIELNEIISFSVRDLMIELNEQFDRMSLVEKCDYLFDRLNRPMRVCGMVKNEGEPGGGPFWVKSDNGEVSLQIVESSQINTKEPMQQKIASEASHFNPVDLVCAVKDYKGRQFDLHDFIDPSTGFISVKSKDGRDLKAQELPGLWNGAMAKWITVFVEVPIITFNPVKTVNDLLREQHLFI
jgi:hypothetical protein